MNQDSAGTQHEDVRHKKAISHFDYGIQNVLNANPSNRIFEAF